jgi:hypothetical protein
VAATHNTCSDRVAIKGDPVEPWVGQGDALFRQRNSLFYPIQYIMRSPFTANEGAHVTSRSCRKAIQVFSIVLFAMAAPQPAAAQDEAAAAEGPFKNILVIFLANSFDSRRYLETEIVRKLEERGTAAVRSTSMMNTKVPMTTETFLAQVEEIGADAVLVTQLADLQTKGTQVTMRPRSTYNIRPTWYFNVWSVELTEYVAPSAMNYEHQLSLATQLYSVEAQEAIWAMESNTDILVAFDQGPDYSIFVDEAGAIVKELRGSGMIAR